MADILRNVTYALGGEETTPGTPESRTAKVPLRGMPTIRKRSTKETDPRIVGRNMAIGQYTTQEPVGGSLPLAPSPSAGLGMILNGWLGKEQSTVHQVGACIRVRYTGTDASAKLSASSSGDTLTSEVGAHGSESPDTNFGTSGDIDLADTGSDTVGELVSTINGYTDYEAEKVFGEDSVDAGEIIDITASQGKNKWVYIWFTSASSGAYLHRWELDLSNTARPVFTGQKDKVHDNFLHTAVAINSMSWSGSLGGSLEADAECLAFDETGGQSAYSGAALESYRPYIFQGSHFSFDGNDWNIVRSWSLDGSNNMVEDGYGNEDLTRSYHEKNQFSASGSFELRYTADVYGYRAQMLANQQVAMSSYFKSPDEIATGIPGLLIIETPAAGLQDYEPTEQDGRIRANIPYQVFAPDGMYDAPLTVSMITPDANVYY